MGVMDLLDEFSIKIYEPPLSTHRDSGRIADTSDPVSVVMLVIDFRTEVEMNSMVDGFIGNSTGLYGAETVRALEIIGCPRQAATLRRILELAAAAGMTHAAIQADRQHLEEFAIASFHQTHGNKWDAASKQIDELEGELDLGEVGECAAQFASRHEALFLRVLGH
jgi:hypothetical protein